MSGAKELTYRDAGVDITAGSETVNLIKESVRRTWRPEVLTEIGGFGGLFALNVVKYREPVLVSGTDGVGTKLRVAMMADRHDTIGIDAVAMCVNDILVHGAEPLFFLDYLAVGKLVPAKAATIVQGVAEGCRQAGCALIGGETAEMPGFYGEDEYDLAGFAVGVVEKSRLITGASIVAGDQILALPSTGLHSNGYSLARKVLFEVGGYQLSDMVPELGKTVEEELLTPTRIYVKLVLKILEQYQVKGMAHITGGGLVENVPRILPAGTSALLYRNSWPVLPIFKLLQKLGNISEAEMFRTFNMGVGLCLVVSAADVAGITNLLQANNEPVYRIGEIIPGDGRVVWTDEHAKEAGE
ncbi:MAG: phosphoribosylformylglycinamidine cyclo-ligase [Firmicutes bacterium]|nr:phosphoribosylformylglycinamidine cyclo-ligase [Bacillota bacterium]